MKQTIISKFIFSLCLAGFIVIPMFLMSKLKAEASSTQLAQTQYSNVQTGGDSIPQPIIKNYSNLSERLKSDQSLINAWKAILSLANIGVILFLFVVAFANILHLKIDTYAVKKALPLLIFGVILANFSLLISRMVVDAATALSWFFVEKGDPKLFTESLVKTVYGDSWTGLGSLTIATLSASFIGLLFGAWALGLFGILLALLIVAAPAIMFLILAFLLYARTYVIVALTAVAPLAFVSLAIPFAQSLFKQWWGWFSRWVFMAPVVFFLLWLAIQFQLKVSGGTTDFGTYLLTLTLIGVSIMVPFKLGGAVMAFWGNRVGKTLAKPFSKFMGNQAGMAWQRASNLAYGKTPLGYLKAMQEKEKATLEEEGKSIMADREAKLREKAPWLGAYGLREAEIKNKTDELEAQKAADLLNIRSGTLKGIPAWMAKSITGRGNPDDIAQKYIEMTNKLKQLQEATGKRDELDLNILSVRDSERHGHLKDLLVEMQNAGLRINSEYDIEGNRNSAGTTTALRYDQALETAEQLRFQARSTDDKSERARLTEAAEYFDNQAGAFAKQNSSWNNPTTGQAEQLHYDHYLSKNLAGRRQKVFNPMAVDEAHTIAISEDSKSVVTETDKDSWGSAEWRGTNKDYDNFVNGNTYLLNDSARGACIFYTRAQFEHMQAARHGDYNGIVTLKEFNRRMIRAGRNDFVVEKSRAALGTMADQDRTSVTHEIAKQYMEVANPAAWATMTDAQKKAHWNNMSQAEQDVALNNFDIAKLQYKGPRAGANQSYAQRLIEEIESDKKLQLTISPGSAARQTKPIP